MILEIERSRMMWWFATLIAIGLFLFCFGQSLLSTLDLYRAQYSNETYAIYLDSGHIFYGTVRGVSPFSLTITNVYSFQTTQVGETTTNNIQAQIENPLTLPDNWLTISRRHVLFIERIGDDAQVKKIMEVK